MSKTYLSLSFLYLLLLFIALANPYRFYGLHLPAISSFSVVEPVLFLGVVCVVLRLLVSRRLRIGSPLLLVVLLLPVILSTISLGWTQKNSYTINEILVTSEAFVAYVVVLNLGQTVKRALLLKILLFFSFFLLLSSLASYPPFNFISPQLPREVIHSDAMTYLLSYNARLSHPFIGLSNNFATILVMLLPVTFLIGKYTRSKLWLFVSSLLLGAIVATLSRGVLLALLLTVVTFFTVNILTTWKINKKLVSYVIWIFFGASIMVCVAYYMAPEMAAHLIGRLQVQGASVRLIAYKEALDAISQRPILGYGAGFPFAMYSSSHLTSIHNTFLQQLFWYGLPFGFIGILGILSFPWVFSRLLLHDYFAYQVRMGIIVAIVCQILLMLTEASWEGSMLRVILYAIIGLITALVLSEPTDYFSGKCT